MKKILTPIEWSTFVGFIIALSILLLIGKMSILFLNQTRTDDQWIEHSHDVIEHLQGSFLAEREMGTRAREYILTGEEKYLRLYQQTLVDLARSIDSVERLTTDNPRQQQLIETTLRPLLNERLAFISRAIIARQIAGQQPAIAIILQNHALALIDQIRGVIEKMQEDERLLLQVRLAQHRQSSEKLRTIILFGSTVAIIFVAIASVQIHRDVVARQSAEEELRASESRLKQQTSELQTMNKELEAFSYSVSHDLRAPLRGIEGFSELILDSYKDRLDAQGQGYFNRICAAAKRMGILIDELLNLSRITRGPLEIRDMDLAAIARDVAADLAKNDPQRRVHWEIPASLPLRGDSALLSVVLVNLFSNAWKFTGKQADARIELGQMTQDGKSVYYVRDNGAGFDMAYQSKLFQAFQRLHTTTEFPGTGIGLATVQRIIHRHGGRVWAEGLVDGGATFFFTL